VPDGLSITARDEGTRARTVDVMRRLIELCADLGGSLLVHGSPKQRGIEPGDTKEAALARARDSFAAIAEDARAAALTYCIEPLAPAETALINTVEEAAVLVEAIASPAVRTMIDTCAAGQSEAASVPALIERWLPTGLIAHIHLNDPNRRAPGQGDMAFAPILATLRDQGYGGICSVEPFVYEPDGPTSAARAIGYLRGALEALPAG
jgi:D-psicose/D-tagatose/L-ribulose 3-epimerase